MKRRFDQWKDSIQKNRNSIAYAIMLLAGFGALAGWGMLPEEVLLFSGENADGSMIDRNSALLAHLGITAFFTGMMWKFPRELTYIIAAILGLLLTLGLILNNAMGM